eukprot:PhF_6_TR10076/c0_g1_i4/m.15646
MGCCHSNSQNNTTTDHQDGDGFTCVLEPPSTASDNAGNAAGVIINLPATSQPSSGDPSKLHNHLVSEALGSSTVPGSSTGPPGVDGNIRSDHIPPTVFEPQAAVDAHSPEQKAAAQQRQQIEAKLRDLRKWLDGVPPEPVPSSTGAISTPSEVSLTEDNLHENIKQLQMCEARLRTLSHNNMLAASLGSPQTKRRPSTSSKSTHTNVTHRTDMISLMSGSRSMMSKSKSGRILVPHHSMSRKASPH